MALKVGLMVILLVCLAALSAYAFEVSGGCAHECGTEYFGVDGYGTATAYASVFNDTPIPDGEDASVMLSWNCGYEESGGLVVGRSESWSESYGGGATAGLIFGVYWYGNWYPQLSYEQSCLVGAGCSEGAFQYLSPSAYEWQGYCNIQGTSNP